MGAQKPSTVDKEEDLPDAGLRHPQFAGLHGGRQVDAHFLQGVLNKTAEGNMEQASTMVLGYVSDDLTGATGSRKEFCASYLAELVGLTRARYEAKVIICDGIDPYALCTGTDTTTDVGLLPVTTHADIVNYLVLSTSHVSPTEMKAYKSLEAHNYFTSGRVSGVTALLLPSKRVIVLSEVGHSQRLREAPLKSWILVDSDGSIPTAHCTCMAGPGEACSHISATLFAMETAVRIRESKTCTQKTNVWLPAHCSCTEYKRLKDIYFASSKKKEKNHGCHS
ncbi:uncharacterized protein [Dermacentor andersoni]|uniref:uncharacterized protein n=1 Tax=Dermacentor andersoni TaxID=34620 RepID=UPI003B3A1992